MNFEISTNAKLMLGALALGIFLVMAGVIIWLVEANHKPDINHSQVCSILEAGATVEGAVFSIEHQFTTDSHDKALVEVATAIITRCPEHEVTLSNYLWVGVHR